MTAGTAAGWFATGPGSRASRAESARIAAQARAESVRTTAGAQAQAQRIRAGAEVAALTRLAEAAAAYAEHPALLLVRERERETLGALARNANARLYTGFDKHSDQLPAGSRSS